MRIISTVPSQTELLFDLELNSEVVGITKFCIHPNDWFKTKEKIGGTKTLNIQKIMDLKPDLIIANKEENTKEQIESLQKHFRTYVSDVKTIDDNINLIQKIGELTGRSKQAVVLQNKISTLIDSLGAPIIKKGSTIYLIWKDPYMTVGGDTFINHIMGMCGFDNVYKSVKRYPEITLDDIQTVSPKFILLSSEPYPFKEKHLEEIKKISPHSTILLVDGEAFSWYGSRLIKKGNYLKNLIENN